MRGFHAIFSGRFRGVNEGIGMAKFQREYYMGFMPKVGCPGCNGYTMEYVEQEP
jgi:hypothetical protein